MSAASTPRDGSRNRWPIRIAAVIVLAPCAYGFGTKFSEFIATFRGSDDGVFVILPMINYLLATIGFSCLLFWSVMHGMFRDVESPKYAFLAREAYLDGERDELEDEDRSGGDDDEPPPHGPSAAIRDQHSPRWAEPQEAVCHV
jgi:hypothetical protein